MGTPTVLGLDIGGANLKAATPDGRAVSVPFALWKQPDALPAALAALVAQFPDATQLAVTMTGELCDCFETKRQGVAAILDATELAAAGRPVRVWGTDGAWRTPTEARANHLTVAAANWHALATFAGRFAPTGGAMLLDIGSTTSDLIPLLDGVPCAKGRTDRERLRNWELIYRGVRRTPLYGVGGGFVCAELFATTADVFLVLGLLPEDPADTDTANGRPFTRDHSLTRLARMFGADREEMSDDDLRAYAAEVHRDMCGMIGCGLNLFWGGRFEYRPDLTVIVSGTGAFLAPGILEKAVPNFPEPLPQPRVVSLNDALGPAVSACAPAYAVAVLASGI